MPSCSRTDSRARPGTNAKIESRMCPSRDPLGVDHLEQPRVGAARVQDVVELLVEGGERPRVEAVEGRGHHVVHGAGPAQVVDGEVAGGQRRGGALDDADGLHREAVLGVVDHRHARADVALERDQTLGLELAHGLADRHHAHVELVGDGAEHQPVARREVLLRDAVLDPAVRRLGLAQARSPPSPRRAPRVVPRSPLRVHREEPVHGVAGRHLLGDPRVLVLLGQRGVDDLLGERRAAARSRRPRRRRRCRPAGSSCRRTRR